MSRRRAAVQSSLELLLDTICNTFGGVLFIAILVVMLLQQSGGIPDDSTPKPASPVELQSLVLRLESATTDLTRLRKNRDSQQVLVEAFAPDTVRAQVAQRRDITEQQERLQSKVDELLAQNAELAVRVENVAVANDAVRTDLDEALTQRALAQAELNRDRQSRAEEVRMPVVRSVSGKQEIGLVLRYGRLYVWHKYGPGHRRLGLNTDDFVVLAEERGGLSTRAKPTGGVALSETEESQEAVRRVLRQFEPKSCYLAIIVRPDSYAAFRQVRDRAIEFGFDYRLMPVEAETPVVDRGGSAGQVQ